MADAFRADSDICPMFFRYRTVAIDDLGVEPTTVKHYGNEIMPLADILHRRDDERKGRWFGGNHDTDHKGSLFLPAAGFGYSNDLGYCAKLAGTSLTGYYWSSSMDDERGDYAGSLHLGSIGVSPLEINLITLGFSVRCVRDKE